MPSNYNAAIVAAAIQDHICLNSFGKRTVKTPSLPSLTRKKKIKAVIDTGLTQKLGILECPAKRLSESEWKTVKEKSNSRHDSCEPCVICKEPFRTDSQVLLSCSHVFHKECLQAFEKFSNRKSCPMCRQQQYETRVIHEGRKQHYAKMATRIQSTWRGYVVHKWYQKIRDTTPPNDPTLRRKYFEKKLGEVADKALKKYDIGVDDFLEEMDRSLAAHRQLFNSLTQSYIGLEQWQKIKSKAILRGDFDCPICVTSIVVEDESFPEMLSRWEIDYQTQDSSEIHTPSNALNRAAFLLSCSHIFHKTCLETFESFMRNSTAPVCPVCRSSYSKKLLSTI